MKIGNLKGMLRVLTPDPSGVTKNLNPTDQVAK